MTARLATFLISFAALPAAAQMQSPTTAAVSLPTAISPSSPTLPIQLGPNARERYRDIFASIDAQRWDEAQIKLDAMDKGPLHAFARGQIFTAKGSPKVEASALAALATEAPELPQAPALVRMASARGATVIPLLPIERPMTWLGSSPRRTRTTATLGDPAAGWMAAQIIPLIKEDRPVEAEAVLNSGIGRLSPEGQTEWRQRVAWAYFIDGMDTDARRVAATAKGGAGEWAAMAEWVDGLAAWRQKNWEAAATSFDMVARRSSDSEMIAAGHYWAARTEMVLKRPERVQPHLRQAARLEETFYGMLAQAAMGLQGKGDDDGSSALRNIAERPNVRTAIALAEIGRLDDAETVLRWQARIGIPSEHATLTLVAGKISLPQTQLYLAHNGPAGARTTVAGRYPVPQGWTPEGGWRVDRALVFAHALQESQFRPNVTSRAGARGLMQVMPATAQLIARRKGHVAVGALNSPSTNMEYGQSYIEQLRDMAATGGLLPKVIMAYNAGPAPLERWNARDERTLNDPLLYIESVSYWETRGYVTTVLRNYWMYQKQTGATTESRTALVQGLWPRFPSKSSAPRAQ